MKIAIFPKTNLGKVTLILIAGFIVLLAIFFILIELGERGGEQFFSNLKLALTGILSALCAITSFFIGLIATIKNKERSLIVFLCMLIGFLILLWVLAEIIFPH